MVLVVESSLEALIEQVHREALERGLGANVPPGEANDLRWYFRTQGAPEDSGWAQMDRGSLYATQARPCTRCGGNLDAVVGGCGWMPSSTARRAPNGYELALMRWEKSRARTLPPRCDVPCTVCNGTGWINGRRKRHWRAVKMFYVSYRHVNGVRAPLRWTGPYTHAQAELAFEDLSCEHDEVCIAKGRSESDGFDALPTGSSVSEGSGGGDDVTTYRAAVVGRRLDEMHERWPLSVEVLDAWYGEDGGTLTAVWSLTASGKTMLRRNKRGLPPQQFFVNERADAEDKQDEQRRALFRGADEQARVLLDAARELWNIVSDSDLSVLDAPGGAETLGATA